MDSLSLPTSFAAPGKAAVTIWPEAFSESYTPVITLSPSSTYPVGAHYPEVADHSGSSCPRPTQTNGENGK